MSFLQVNDVSFAYKMQKEEHRVLEHIHFSIEEGESVGLIGANGVGKSTLLKILVGLLENYSGDVFVEDELLSKKTIRSIRKKIGYVFQDSDHQLFMNTVYDDVAFAPRNYGLTEEEVRERVNHALKMVHMEELKDRQIFRISGGEKKLAAIATVIAMGAKCILFDEPSVALDPKNRRNLIRVCNQLPQAKFIASHDLDFIYDTCEKTILIDRGKIIAQGKTKDILSNQSLLEEHGLELPLSMIKR